jgi:2-iminobutanoate/2-iminopropanoate deaminase
MTKKTIHTSAAPKAIGPYSQAVVSQGVAYLSGQIPLDPQTGALNTGGIAEQTRQVLDNLAAVLSACGCSLESVLKVNVYLRDMGDFAAMNEVYASYFAADPPARAAIQAARLPKDVRVEMDAIAEVIA